MLSPVLVTLSHTAIEKSRKLRMKYPSIVKRAEQGRCCIRYNSIGTCLNYAQEQYGVSGQDIFPHREEDEIHVLEGLECEGIRNAKVSDCVAQLTTLMLGHLLTRSPESPFS